MINAHEIAPHFGYSPETGMVMLDVGEAVGTLQPMEVEGVLFTPKTEFHSTLVSMRREASPLVYEIDFVTALGGFLEQAEIRLETIRSERYMCQKGEEASIIAPVELEGDEALRTFVRRYYPQYNPFFHVTTHLNASTDYGIRVSSESDLQNRCTLL